MDEAANARWFEDDIFGDVSYTSPSGETVNVILTRSLDDAVYVAMEHNTRLMQIETKNEIILALRQDKRQLREENRNLRQRVNELSWALNPEERG
jgi:hypothetical protein